MALLSRQGTTWRKAVGLGVMAVLSVASLVATASPVAAAQTAPSRLASPTSLQSVERSASALAASSGRPVVIDKLTTATTQTTAEPDGTIQFVSNSVPVRAQVAGKWAPIDLALEAVGGYLVPKVAAQAVRFSPGGAGPLAQIRDGSGKWVQEGSPFGDLPKPSITGATATYADVLPGVDLRLTATALGMSEILVLKTAAAAKNSKLKSVHFGVTGSAVSADAFGNARAGADGSKGVIAGSATWWDSSEGSDASGPAGMIAPRPLPQSITADAVTLSVDAAASTPAVQFPLYIDPDWTGGLGAYWYVDQAYANQSYLNGNQATGVQRMGYITAAYSPDGRNHLARAFWSMDTSGVAGRHVLNAHFDVTLTGAFNCNTPSQADLWTTAGAPVGGTWNQTGNVYASMIGTATPTACGAVGFGATAGAAAAANAGASSTVLALRADNENAVSGWKKWAQSASLTITYDSAPVTPDTPQFSSPFRSCAADVRNPAFVNNAASALTMAANSSDPDGTNISVSFDVAGVDGSGNLGSTLHTYTSSTHAAGAFSGVIPQNALGVGKYAWRAHAFDGTDWSGYSGWCYFEVQNSGPSLPTVHEVNSGGTTISPATGTVGKPITVKLTSSTLGTAAAQFGYWWTNTAAVNPSPIPPVTFGPRDDYYDGNTMHDPTGQPLCPEREGAEWFACPDSSGSATITVAPIDAPHATLWVVAYDGAGNVSTNLATSTDPSEATGLEVATSGDTTSVQYANSSGGDFWNADDFTSGTIPDRNSSHSTSNMTVPADDIEAMPGDSPLADAQTLSFHGGTDTLYDFPSSSGWASATFSTLNWTTNWSPPAVNLGEIKPYPTDGSTTVPDGMTTLYDCLGSFHYSAITANCNGTNNAAHPIGLIWTASTASQNATSPLYYCGVGVQETHTLCSGGSLLGYVQPAFEQGTALDTVALGSDDTTHGWTISAWVDFNPNGEDLSGMPYTSMALGYDNTFGVGVAPDGRWQLCWPDWGPPAYTPCITGPNVTPSTWTYISVIWDPVNSQLRLVVNGQVSNATVASRQSQSTMGGPTNHTLLVGAGAADQSTEWNGYIDDITSFPGVADSLQLANLKNENAPQ